MSVFLQKKDVLARSISTPISLTCPNVPGGSMVVFFYMDRYLMPASFASWSITSESLPPE